MIGLGVGILKASARRMARLDDLAEGDFAGLTPSYYIDFLTNRAIANGADVGAISSIPSITGTLALSASGHLVSGAANGLIIPLTGVTYPLTFLVEFIRSTDSGGNEVVAVLDAGSAANLTMYRIDTGDQLRLRVDTASVNQSNVGGGAAMTSVPTNVQRAAGRVSTNSAQNCRNGTLGTEDTSVTLPSNPTRLIVGVDSSGVQTFTGYIRKIAIFAGAATDAQLQAAVA